MKIPSGTFIRKNVLVDPFMTDPKTVVVLEPFRYLLRTPILIDQGFDQDPGGGSDARGCFLASAQRKLVSLLRAMPL
jgi:hypothetical protein